MIRTFRPRRSVLYVPASNNRALVKAASLDADAIIFDLEDAVAPDVKEDAREALREYFLLLPKAKPNALSASMALRANGAPRICLLLVPADLTLSSCPRWRTPQDVTGVAEILEETDASEGIRLWAMIETPRGILNADEIAELGLRSTARLECFVIGTNDISKETGTKGRGALMPWLMQVLLCAKAGKLDIIDGVYNDFSDLDGFAAECTEAVRMGFDGKSLIHPSQIETANTSFFPDTSSVAEARLIVEAFSNRENLDKGVTSLNGKMVERLHLEMAKKLLAKLDIIGEK